jgi:hypothetical protein
MSNRSYRRGKRPVAGRRRGYLFFRLVASPPIPAIEAPNNVHGKMNSTMPPDTGRPTAQPITAPTNVIRATRTMAAGLFATAEGGDTC